MQVVLRHVVCTACALSTEPMQEPVLRLMRVCFPLLALGYATHQLQPEVVAVREGVVLQQSVGSCGKGGALVKV